MSKLTSYKNNLDDAMKKVKNNADYFESFGDVYITEKLKSYLDNIYEEMNKIRSLIVEKENNLVETDVNASNI